MQTIRKMNFDMDDASFDDGLSKKYNIPVVEAKSFHRLNQIIGYAKHINGKSGNIYFRGQSHLYKSCYPSLLRKVQSIGAFQKGSGKLSKFLGSVKKQVPLTSKVDDVFLEPLMQHYGISTRWIDLVDNIWVAIWFGLHEYKVVRSKQEVNRTNPYTRDYVHVSKRVDGDMYILLIHSDAIATPTAGYYLGKDTKLVDLRIGCPPMFLRPHAQHGLLALARGDNLKNHDFYKRTAGIVKISVQNALDWLGNGNLLTHANMYPSPVYDYGYRFLLDVLKVEDQDRKALGTIKIYAAS